jgi:hypothetical protein
VLDTLTIPDMLSIMSGNWVPLQGVYPVLKTHLLQTILKGDTSNTRLEKLSDDIVDSMRDSFDEKNLPNVLNKNTPYSKLLRIFELELNLASKLLQSGYM